MVNGPDPPDRRKLLWLVVLGLALLICDQVLALVFSGDIRLWWAVPIVLVMVVAIAVQLDPGMGVRVRSWTAERAGTARNRCGARISAVRRSLGRTAGDRAGSVGVLLLYVGAAVVGVVVAFGVLQILPVRLAPAARVPCQEPQEFRVATSVENHAAIDDAGQRFAALQVADGRCPLVHFTVRPIGSFLDVQYGFTHGWQDSARPFASSEVVPLLSPRPDLWLPATTAEAEFVDSLSHPGVVLDSLGSVASSPLVLAVPEDYRDAILSHLPTTSTWKDVLEAASKAGLQVGRPDPDLSEAGLLATADLYRTTADAGARRATEAAVAAGGAPRASALDLLCVIRGQSRPRLAVVVPEKAMRDYNAGQPLGTDCPTQIRRAEEPYIAVHPSDARSLDLPVVRVTWNGQADRDRDALAGRFASWLRDGGLRSGAHLYRDVEGNASKGGPANFEPSVRVRRFTAEEIGRTVEDYRSARTSVAVALVLDTSGSMNDPVPAGPSRLDRGKQIVAQALGLLGPADRAGLLVFPDPKDPLGTVELPGAELRPVHADHRESVLRALSGMEPKAMGGSSPLFDSIDEATRLLDGRGEDPAVIVLSDGDNSAAGGLGADKLVDSLKAMKKPPRIVILALSKKGCEEPDVKALTGPLPEIVCRPAATRETGQLISEVVVELRNKGAR